MFTPFDSYFLNQAERPRTSAERLAEDRRAAEFVATFAQGRRSVRRAWDRALRKR
jgi:hypothetical protein